MSSPSTARSTSEWQNIGRKLPLLTAVLVSVAVAVIVGAAYYQLKRVLIDAAGEHLLNAAQQVAAGFAKTEDKLERDGMPLSRDSSVRAALEHPGAATLAAAAQQLAARAKTNQTITVELWNPRGVRLAAAGEGPNRPFPFVGFTSGVGPLLALSDTVFSQAQAPILSDTRDTLGFVREITRISSAQSKPVLAGLIGGNATLLIGNAAGDVWTDLVTRVGGPRGAPKSGIATVVSKDGTSSIGALAIVTGTPWRIWVERPEADVLGQAHAFFLRMLLVALVVLGVCVIGARQLSAHFIGPLAELTRAAASIAGGDYSTRAGVTRPDEVGRLAVDFNSMASAIETAHVELEDQQIELESQQLALQTANEELRRTLTDVTAAREGEERSHARTAAIIAGAIDAVITIDEDERIVEFNPAAERMFGYPASDAKGRLIRQLIAPPSTNEETNSGASTSIVGSASSQGRPVELVATRADGAAFFVELAATRIPVAGPPMYTCFVRDLSERKQLEAQLRHAQKMEAVGRLAGGVAHDFNNILTVIVSYIEVALANAELAEPVRSDLMQVRSAADRAAQLTRQLLAFSRKQVLHPVVLDLNDVVGGVTTMLARVMPENIRVASALGSSLDRIFVDRGQLEQVLMNLAVNAGDAMPAGGSLMIETSNAALDDAYVAIHPEGSTGPHVVLTVRDTGFGMDAATRDRIFEPFFTTKPVGQGTGLGLATVYGIVQQSGGSIYVYSEPGRGTMFKVYFPAYAGVGGAPDATEDLIIAAARPITVLLVEDDPAVRAATELVLRRLGHQVVQAPDAATALGLIRAGAGSFDVVLTDAVMPGKSGLELAEVLRHERAGLPVILMSGYAEETIHRDASRMHGVVFVEKPFTASVVAKALADAMGKGATRQQ